MFLYAHMHRTHGELKLCAEWRLQQQSTLDGLDSNSLNSQETCKNVCQGRHKIRFSFFSVSVYVYAKSTGACANACVCFRVRALLRMEMFLSYCFKYVTIDQSSLTVVAPRSNAIICTSRLYISIFILDTRQQALACASASCWLSMTTITC